MGSLYSQRIVGVADGAHHAVRSARAAKDLRVARAPESVSIGDALMSERVYRDRLFVGVGVTDQGWNVVANRVVDGILGDDGTALSIGGGAERTAQAIVAGDGVRLRLVGCDVARWGIDGVEQALGDRSLQEIVDSERHDGLTCYWAGRLCFDKIAIPVVPLFHGRGGTAGDELRAGVQFQAGRGLALATGVGIGIADRRAAQRVARAGDGGEAAQHVVLILRRLIVGIGLGGQPLAEAAGGVGGIGVGGSLIERVGRCKDMSIRAVIDGTGAILVAVFGAAQVAVAVDGGDGVAGGVIGVLYGDQVIRAGAALARDHRDLEGDRADRCTSPGRS